MIRVTSLRIHPLKSGAIRPLESSAVTPAGLDGDRRWMVVDADGECVTARTDRALFTLTAEPLADNGLRLTSRSGQTVEVCRPLTSARQVTVHGRPVAPGIPLEESAQHLVREVLQREDVTILWCSSLTERRLNPEFSTEGDSTAYADGYPVTLASLASLRELNRLGGMDLRIDRFRPNIVIDGGDELAPFAEESWQRLRIGEVDFRVAKGVDRCSMTLVDPDTLQTGPEPIRTLSRHRKRDGRTWFCMHLIPEGTGRVTVGDEVSIA